MKFAYLMSFSLACQYGGQGCQASETLSRSLGVSGGIWPVVSTLKPNHFQRILYYLVEGHSRRLSVTYQPASKSSLIVLQQQTAMAGDAVLVFGATGPSGLCVLRELLHRNHHTIAYVRNPSKIPADLQSNPLLEVRSSFLTIPPSSSY